MTMIYNFRAQTASTLNCDPQKKEDAWLKIYVYVYQVKQLEDERVRKHNVSITLRQNSSSVRRERAMFSFCFKDGFR